MIKRKLRRHKVLYNVFSYSCVIIRYLQFISIIFNGHHPVIVLQMCLLLLVCFLSSSSRSSINDPYKSWYYCVKFKQFF
jgi:hypothetical protein